MTATAKTKTFDGKQKNQRVRVKYNLDRECVRLICKKPETGAEYLRRLITDQMVGRIDAVIYSSRQDSKVVWLLRGDSLDKFLRTQEEIPQPDNQRKSFTQIASEAESSDTGS